MFTNWAYYAEPVSVANYDKARQSLTKWSEIAQKFTERAKILLISVLRIFVYYMYV